VIKAVIFDCFGVLTVDTWVEFCGTLPEGEVADTARRLNHQYDSGKISLKEFLDEVSRVTGRVRSDIVAIFTHPAATKNARLFEYIQELSSKYKIGLLSNVGTNWVREDFLNTEEQKLFSAMVFSYEIGTTKPDPKAYEAIANKLGAKPSEAVFIDDQLAYCEGAEDFGMKAIVYSNFPQIKTELEQTLSAANN